MIRPGWLAIGLALVLTAAAATRELPMGDAARGERLVREKTCLECHSLNRRGAGRAPDLALAVTRGFSPYHLAALIWNHSPGMSAAWRARQTPRPELTPQDAADLFAYFYASRYFHELGDEGRGKNLFRKKGCAVCHGLTAPSPAGAPPVASWESPNDPVALAAELWRHSGQMRQAMGRAGVPLSSLSAAELTDLLAFLRAQSRQPHEAAVFKPGSPVKGRELVSVKGCVRCHQGSRSLEGRPTRYTLVDFAAGMWNHPPDARRMSAELSRAEMADLMAYLLATQFREERGDAARGARVFAARHCRDCHDNAASGAPPRSGMTGRMNSYAMVAAAWRHAPVMEERMRARNLAWPRLSSSEMADLIAYLNGQRLRQRSRDGN